MRGWREGGRERGEGEGWSIRKEGRMGKRRRGKKAKKVKWGRERGEKYARERKRWREG